MVFKVSQVPELAEQRVGVFVVVAVGDDGAAAAAGSGELPLPADGGRVGLGPRPPGPRRPAVVIDGPVGTRVRRHRVERRIVLVAVQDVAAINKMGVKMCLDTTYTTISLLHTTYTICLVNAASEVIPEGPRERLLFN